MHVYIILHTKLLVPIVTLYKKLAILCARKIESGN